MFLHFAFPRSPTLHSCLPRKEYTTIQWNMIRYNPMRYDIIQFNAMQYDTIQCNTIWYNPMHYDKIQFNAIQYDTIQCNLVWYNATQCNAMKCNAIQYDVTFDLIRLARAKLVMPTTLCAVCGTRWTSGRTIWPLRCTSATLDRNPSTSRCDTTTRSCC